MALVIMVAQQKGGSGKTTLSAHLSVAWANPSADPGGHKAPALRVIALDLDPQGSLSTWYKIRTEAGVGDGDLEVRSAIGWRLWGELARANRTADIVVLDLPPGMGVAPMAFRAADLVVVPLQLSPMDLWATGPTIDLALKSGARPLLVLNRVPPHARLNDAVIAEAKGADWPIARASLGNRTGFASSVMHGRGVTEEAPTSLAAAEMRLLAREIMQTTRAYSRAA